jgi:hypothetical protein
VLPELEEEEEMRREDVRWLKNLGTTLPREPPPHNTPPLIFIFLLFAFLFYSPHSLYLFSFSYREKIKKTNLTFKNKIKLIEY